MRGPMLDEIEGNDRDDDLSALDHIDGLTADVNRLELEVLELREEAMAANQEMEAADELRRDAEYQLNVLRERLTTTAEKFAGNFEVVIEEPLSATPESAVAEFNSVMRELGSEFATWVRENIVPLQMMAEPEASA